MNNTILLQNKNFNASYENLDHLYIRRPFKFRLCPTEPPGKREGSVHKDLEFNLITAGELSITLNGVERIYKAGEISIINQFVPHVYNIFEKTKYTHLIIKTQLLEDNGIDISKLWFDELIVNPDLKRYFDEMERVEKSKLPYRNLEMQGLILQLISIFARDYSTNRTDTIDNAFGAFGNDIEYTRRAMDYISANFQKELTIEEISAALGISKFHLMHTFKKVVGITVIDHVNSVRCARAEKMLSSGEYTVAEAAASSGFNNFSYFAKIFKKNTGNPPSYYLPKTKKQEP